MPTSIPVLIVGFDTFGDDRNCGDFTDWQTAQSFFVAAGGPTDAPHQLDGDNDGTACESLTGAP
ncbi:MAG: excalibur calcium-binding domain-containing protein [Chloroflexi bacterium]|nr:excalibur calcium-binding domain-containing protein [Chloroflexota bacterium]MDA1283233.1 excalibur calcium-binding domain-containing protein [Chloroflexota bacterium]